MIEDPRIGMGRCLGIATMGYPLDVYALQRANSGILAPPIITAVPSHCVAAEVHIDAIADPSIP